MTETTTKMTTLSEYVRAAGITVRAGTGVVRTDADGWQHRAYRVTLQRPGAEPMRAAWRAGMGIEDHPSDTPAEVFSALLSDALSGGESFSDFCADFGYALDSRKAHGTWQQCRRISERLTTFVGGPSEMSRVSSLENDV